MDDVVIVGDSSAAVGAVVEEAPPGSARAPARARTRAHGRVGAVVREALGRAVRSHVAHFLVLGGLIFALAPRPPSGRDIHLTRTQLGALYGAEARRSGKALGPERREAIDARAVEDEILYREALRLGLDRGDGIVRQRLIQKVIFLAEDLGGAAARPTEADLRAYYEETRERWQVPERWRFVHVFAGPGKRAELLALRPRVIAEGTGDAPPALGDAFPLARSVAGSRAEIEREYGESFAKAVAVAEAGAWTEPVESRFGVHLVKVIAHEPARPQSYEEARPRLKLARLVDVKEKALRSYMESAFERYQVDVDGEPVASYVSSGRASPERQPSED